MWTFGEGNKKEFQHSALEWPEFSVLFHVVTTVTQALKYVLRINVFLELYFFFLRPFNSTPKRYLVYLFLEKEKKKTGNYKSLPINVLSQLIPPIA